MNIVPFTSTKHLVHSELVLDSEIIINPQLLNILDNIHCTWDKLKEVIMTRSTCQFL